MEVIDNFLGEDDFKRIQSVLMGSWFSWYYNDFVVSEGDSLYQFTHTFYHPPRPPSNPFPLLDSCQTKLGVKVLHRIKKKRYFGAFYIWIGSYRIGITRW